MSLPKRSTRVLACVLVAFLSCGLSLSAAHAESTWVKQVKRQLEKEDDPDTELVTRCILTRAMLCCDLVHAIELADEAFAKAKNRNDSNAMAVALMLKSTALRDSKRLAESTKAYARSLELFDDRCCAEMRTLFWISRAKRDLRYADQQQIVEVLKKAREAAKRSTDPMVNAIVAMELSEFRAKRISDEEFAVLKKHTHAVGVPSMGWICELKKLRGEYDATKIPALYADRVAELASLAKEDGSLDALSVATRFQLMMQRNSGDYQAMLLSAEKLQDIGRKLGSSLWLTVGLTNEAISHLRLGDLPRAKTKIGEAMEYSSQIDCGRVKRFVYSAHIEICIESGENRKAIRSVQKLKRAGAPFGNGASGVNTFVLRSELERLLVENAEANSLRDQLQSEKQKALNQLSRMSKRVAIFSSFFLAGFAAVLWRNHLRVTRINRSLRDVNTRLKDEMEAGEKNQVIREALEQRIARVQRMESLGLLAGGIAHDFNNLLVGVVCNAQLLQRSELQGNIRERCIDGILKSAETATDLSRKMLAYAGREPSARAKVDVVALVKSMQPIFDSGASVDTNVEFDFLLERAYAAVDETQLEQIILNLVSNARDASEEGKQPVVVRVGLETIDNVAADSALMGRRTDGDEFVFVEVQDRGVGIIQEEMAKIFEPFYRTKATGRGMGLAVVYGLVNRHDGLIRCTSEPGVGTTMRVLLPQSIAVAVCTTKEAVDVVPSLAKYDDSTLVVIDDEAGILDVISRTFESAAWNVKTFKSGKEAIPFIAEHRNEIDCILSDVIMPEMSGKLVVDRIHELGIRIPIVMMSGFSDTNLNEFLTLPNVVLTMEKPFSVSELFEKVSQATFFVQEDAVARN